MGSTKTVTPRLVVISDSIVSRDTLFIVAEGEHLAGTNRTVVRVHGSKAKERAEFIVRACNAHDDLVKALQGLIDFAEPVLQNHGFGYMGKFEAARKALEKAGAA